MSTDPVQDTNVFTQPTTIIADPVTTTAAQPDAPITTVTTPDPASELVGEGKKYANVEAALAASAHAQVHITNIEAENLALREQVAKAKGIEEVISEMKANQPQVQDPVQETVNEDAIATQVLNTLAANEAAKLTADNIKSADIAVKNLYGDKAGEMTQAAAEKFGISLEMLGDIAGKSPEAFFKLLADNTNTSSSVPLHVAPSVNTEAVINHLPTDDLKKPEGSVLYNASSGSLLSEWQRCKALAAREEG